MQNGFEDMRIIERQEEARRLEMNIIRECARLASDAEVAWAQYQQDEQQSWLEDMKEEARATRNAWKSLFGMARKEGCSIIFAPFLDVPIKLVLGAKFAFFSPTLDDLIAAKNWLEEVSKITDQEWPF